MLTFTPSPDRFVVEEIPAYAPSRRGHAHVPVAGEARPHDVRRHRAVAKAFGVSSRDIGYAGHEGQAGHDAPVAEPARASTPSAPSPLRPGAVRVLTAARHGHKLRLGHLRGNRFETVLAGAATDDEVAALRARFADLSARRRPQPLRRATFRHRRGQRHPRPRPAARRAPGARQAQAQAVAVRAAVGRVQPDARAAGNPGRADRRPSGRRAQEDGHGRAVRVDGARGRPAARGRGRADPHGAPARRPGDRAAARHARPRARGRGDRGRRRHARRLRAPRPRAPRRAPPGPAPDSRSRRFPRRPAPTRGRAPCACASPCRRAATRRWSWLP